MLSPVLPGYPQPPSAAVARNSGRSLPLSLGTRPLLFAPAVLVRLRQRLAPGKVSLKA